MARRSPTTDPDAAGTNVDEMPGLSPSGPLPAAFDDPAFGEAFGPDADFGRTRPPSSPPQLLLVPTLWRRFAYRAWHPVARSFLATLLIVALMPVIASVNQLSDAGPGSPPPVTIITVPVTISVPLIATPSAAPGSTPPPLSTLLATVETATGASTTPMASTPPVLADPKRGRTAVTCFTPAALDLVVTGEGEVGLVVTGGATAHAAGNGSARLRVSGRSGTYTFTYAASGGGLDINWSALRGMCSG